MSFLRRFASVFGAYSRKKDVPDARAHRVGFVDERMPLARFLTSSAHYSAAANRVKAGAFLPNPKDMTTSVFVVDDLAATDVHQIGRTVAALSPGLKLHGFASIGVMSVNAQGLRVDYCEPPVRHAEISGWPEDADAFDAKAARKKIALELAAAASLSLFDGAEK
jgi:hypothetical protein